MQAQDLKQKFESEFYAKTGIDISKYGYFGLDFIEKLREDVANYLNDTLYYNCNGDFIFLYYFDTDTIKQLVDYYFETTGIDKADIMPACEGLGNFTNKYIDYLPYFESNVFCSICEELAFNIVRAVF